MEMLDKVFAPVFGKPCWNVEAVAGSCLALEFGEMCLWIRNPRVAAHTVLGRLNPRKSSPTVNFHGK